MSRLLLCLTTIGAVFLMPLLLGGCSSSPKSRTVKTANSMTTTMEMLEQAQVRIDATVASMNNLSSAAATEIRPAYRAFTRELDQLESTADRTRERARSMSDRAGSFFKNWEKELEDVDDPELRLRGQKRQQFTQESYDSINAAMQEAKDAFEPLLALLRDIETVLRNDLNPAGVAGVQDIMRGAATEAVNLKSQIADVIDEISRVREAFVPTGG